MVTAWPRQRGALIHEYLPHRMSGNREQVRTVASCRDAARQLQVGLMDERGRINGAHTLLACELSARESSEVVVENRDHPVQRRAIAGRSRLEQARYVADLFRVG